MTSGKVPYLPPPPLIEQVILAALPNAVKLSRAMVGLALDRWGLTRIADDAEAVASELVTNAVRATGLLAERPTWDQIEKVPVIRVRVSYGETFVLIEVWDEDAGTMPAPQDPVADEEEGGRGLTIVDALTEQWGFYPSVGAGKVVWAQLAIPPLPMTDAGLPRRVAQQGKRPPVQPYEPSIRYDAATLNRIYQGLKAL